MFLNKIRIKDEPILEPFLRWLRFESCKNFYLPHLKILDYGCGPTFPFYKYLTSRNFLPSLYIGCDPLLKSLTNDKSFKTVNSLTSIHQKFDIISMFAVMEHVDYPGYDFTFLTKHLRRDGLLMLTTPSPAGKSVLEFLCYRLGLVSKREIDEHKHYYSIQEIESIFTHLGFKKVVARHYFLNWIIAAVFQKT